MLARTIRDNLKNINNLKMPLKPRKFSDLFQSVPAGAIENSEDMQFVTSIDIKSDEKNSDIDVETCKIEEYDYSNCIVENPEEVIVQFPIISDIKLDTNERLPFFRSISLKLASL